MDRKIKAINSYGNGYNCAQAVFCAYCDMFGIDEATGYKLSEGLGSGTGGLKSTCGAINAAFLLCGLSESDGEVGKKNTTLKTYAKIRMMEEAFRGNMKSIDCKDIKGAVDENGNCIRSCKKCVEDATEIVEKFLLK